MSQQPTEKYLRTRRFRLFLPVLIVPIVTVFFSLMGGGAGSVFVSVKKNGLNTSLPDPQLKTDASKDKLAFYVAAEADSNKRMEEVGMDPYRRDTAMLPTSEQVAFEKPELRKTATAVGLSERIEALRQQATANPVTAPEFTAAKTIGKTNPVPDPELESINATLDKIMAIQNPQHYELSKTIGASRLLTVSAGAASDNSYFGKHTSSNYATSFYGDGKKASSDPGAITAMIPVDQILQNGSVVKLELQIPVTINRQVIPAGTHIFGTAAFEGERLQVHISSIRVQNNLFPVSLRVFDLDGLPGIFVPGSIARDVAKSSADNALQSVGISGFDLSLKTQAAAAGIGAAKSLFSKKVKQVRVTVGAGYRVLLCDQKIVSQ